MRDASGNLVEDGTNATADDIEAIKAPAEPVLVQLTSVCVEMLVERYVRWTVTKEHKSYFGACPDRTSML